ncbi:hypothetical protein ERJ75_000712000 [Trypanosoma vivax]|uniref:Uncharacterized protein n=1 Tax=Trypanosoma vivax (strain Y486) TaxID=1055687 RepID=G0TTV3_TRYVY|nr:hypothetical protein TRVL_00043 [Trypanosoma vivax]KAH8613562.1 hypothetical protein ERJ75_000712000 [Trypanosoma vivax]CCC47386.1 conserved hypothetical protein [Trypanosoma vivax Y486]
MDDITYQYDGGRGVVTNAAMELSEIQRKLDELKQRRGELEEQRRQILRNLDSTSSQNASRRSGVRNGEELKNSPNRSHMQSSRGLSRNGANVSVMNHSFRIPSEMERQKEMKRNVYCNMKESIRKSWEQDSSLVMGTFLLEDNPRSCTFGRERRFIPLNNSKGQYFLSTDVELMIKNKNNIRSQVSTSDRGGRLMNPTNHWNDMVCSGSPGPGAYTPLFSKASKPPLLWQRREVS